MAESVLVEQPDLLIDGSYRIREIILNKRWDKDLGTAFKEYRRKWGEATQKCKTFDFPLFLEVESIYACNYRCPFCPTTILEQGSNFSRLSDDLFDKLFAEAGKEGLYSINFSHGGEPTLRRDLPELVAKAKAAGILDRMIHTNGSLLNKGFSRKLIEAGLTKINFSLDAVTEETYKKVRIGGNYSRVIKNVMDFLEIKKEFGFGHPRVRVSFVMSQENIHEAGDFIKFWQDKVDVIALQEMKDFTTMKTKEIPKGIDYNNMTYRCSQLFQLLTVRADGDITPCEHIYEENHDYVLGNLATHTIKECWLGEKLSKLRRAHITGKWGSDIPKCKQCIWNMLNEQKRGANAIPAPGENWPEN